MKNGQIRQDSIIQRNVRVYVLFPYLSHAEYFDFKSGFNVQRVLEELCSEISSLNIGETQLSLVDNNGWHVWINKIGTQRHDRYNVDLSDIDGNSIICVSRFTDCVRSRHLMSSLWKILKQNSTMKERFQRLTKSYCGFRSVKGDGNCYYRAVYFSLFEQIIVSKKTSSFKALYDVFSTISFSDDSDDFSEFMQTLKLASEGRAWNTIEEFQGDILNMPVTNNGLDTTLDLTIIKACRQIVAQYLLHNKNLKLSDLTIKQSILPLYPDIQSMEQYCEKYVLKMGVDAEGPFVNLGVLLLAFNCTCTIVLLDSREDVEMAVVECGSSVVSVVGHIHLLLRNLHYDVLYPVGGLYASISAVANSPGTPIRLIATNTSTPTASATKYMKSSPNYNSGQKSGGSGSSSVGADVFRGNGSTERLERSERSPAIRDQHPDSREEYVYDHGHSKYQGRHETQSYPSQQQKSPSRTTAEHHVTLSNADADGSTQALGKGKDNSIHGVPSNRISTQQPDAVPFTSPFTHSRDKKKSFQTGESSDLDDDDDSVEDEENSVWHVVTPRQSPMPGNASLSHSPDAYPASGTRSSSGIVPTNSHNRSNLTPLNRKQEETKVLLLGMKCGITNEEATALAIRHMDVDAALVEYYTPSDTSNAFRGEKQAGAATTNSHQRGDMHTPNSQLVNGAIDTVVHETILSPMGVVFHVLPFIQMGYSVDQVTDAVHHGKCQNDEDILAYLEQFHVHHPVIGTPAPTESSQTPVQTLSDSRPVEVPDSDPHGHTSSKSYALAPVEGSKYPVKSFRHRKEQKEIELKTKVKEKELAAANAAKIALKSNTLNNEKLPSSDHGGGGDSTDKGPVVSDEATTPSPVRTPSQLTPLLAGQQTPLTKPQKAVLNKLLQLSATMSLDEATSLARIFDNVHDAMEYYAQKNLFAKKVKETNVTNFDGEVAAVDNVNVDITTAANSALNGENAVGTVLGQWESIPRNSNKRSPYVNRGAGSVVMRDILNEGAPDTLASPSIELEPFPEAHTPVTSTDPGSSMYNTTYQSGNGNSQLGIAARDGMSSYTDGVDSPSSGSMLAEEFLPLLEFGFTDAQIHEAVQVGLCNDVTSALGFLQRKQALLLTSNRKKVRQQKESQKMNTTPFRNNDDDSINSGGGGLNNNTNASSPTRSLGNISPYTPQRQPSLPRLRSSLKKANEDDSVSSSVSSVSTTGVGNPMLRSKKKTSFAAELEHFEGDQLPLTKNRALGNGHPMGESGFMDDESVSSLSSTEMDSGRAGSSSSAQLTAPQHRIYTRIRNMGSRHRHLSKREAMEMAMRYQSMAEFDDYLLARTPPGSAVGTGGKTKIVTAGDGEKRLIAVAPAPLTADQKRIERILLDMTPDMSDIEAEHLALKFTSMESFNDFIKSLNGRTSAKPVVANLRSLRHYGEEEDERSVRSGRSDRSSRSVSSKASSVDSEKRYRDQQKNKSLWDRYFSCFVPQGFKTQIGSGGSDSGSSAGGSRSGKEKSGGGWINSNHSVSSQGSTKSARNNHYGQNSSLLVTSRRNHSNGGGW